MSNKEGMLGIEDKNRVVITSEDAQDCAKFFEFFEIPIPSELQEAFDNFIKNPTLPNQEELKFELAKIIATSDNPLFEDDVFVQVRPETREVHESLVFERELEKQITSTDG